MTTLTLAWVIPHWSLPVHRQYVLIYFVNSKASASEIPESLIVISDNNTVTREHFFEICSAPEKFIRYYIHSDRLSTLKSTTL